MWIVEFILFAIGGDGMTVAYFAVVGWGPESVTSLSARAESSTGYEFCQGPALLGVRQLGTLHPLLVPFDLFQGKASGRLRAVGSDVYTLADPRCSVARRSSVFPIWPAERR